VRLLCLSIDDLARSVWRVPVATAMMAGIMLLVHAVWPERNAVAWNLGALFGLLGAGAASYLVVLMGLWRLSGQPDGAERHVLAAVKPKLPLDFRSWNVSHN
jgi:hypothetical protein